MSMVSQSQIFSFSNSCRQIPAAICAAWHVHTHLFSRGSHGPPEPSSRVFFLEFLHHEFGGTPLTFLYQFQELALQPSFHCAHVQSVGLQPQKPPVVNLNQDRQGRIRCFHTEAFSVYLMPCFTFFSVNQKHEPSMLFVELGRVSRAGPPDRGR